MIVWLDDDLFNGKSREVDLLTLLRAAAFRRHTLIISTIPGRTDSSPQFDAWFAQLSNKISREIDQLRRKTSRVSAAALAHGARLSVAVTRRDSNIQNVVTLTIDEAIRSLSLPLFILVENQINDGAFLRKVLPKNWAKRFEVWERTGELRFVQGGGNTEIARLIEFHLDDAMCRQSFGLPSSIWRLNHFIIYDHDGDRPDVPGEGAKILDKLGAMLRGHHRLHRRTQENYLPMQVLRMIAKLKLTNIAELERMRRLLAEFEKQGEARFFALLPRLGEAPFYKNEFHPKMIWDDEAASLEGFDMEMTRLAETVAAAI